MAEAEARLATPPLGLYVHLPWCARKCPYCDFNSHVHAGALPERRYLDALLADLERQAARVAGRRLVSVFIGGGTPSLFSAEAVARLLEAARAALPCAPELEITLEANPGSAEAARFADYRAAGVNRLSLGVQSFHDHLLERIGRVHDARDARRAFEFARRAGFARINIDLMFALPGQTLAEAVADIEEAVALGPEHLSHYQLTLEPGTAFARRPPALPDDELAWRMQRAAGARLRRAGYRRYEVSAWARPGQRCRHNLNYWRFGDYLGIGAGAHQKLTFPERDRILRRHTHRLPEHYMREALAGRAAAGEDAVEGPQRLGEFFLCALRLEDGFGPRLLERRTGLPWAAARARLEPLARRGLLELGTRVRPSALGRRHLDTLLVECL